MTPASRMTQKTVFEHCKRHGKLCKTFRRKRTGETEVEYFLEPGGKAVPEKVAQKVIASGRLKPFGDDLFDTAANSQTWGVPTERRESHGQDQRRS